MQEKKADRFLYVHRIWTPPAVATSRSGQSQPFIDPTV